MYKVVEIRVIEDGKVELGFGLLIWAKLQKIAIWGFWVKLGLGRIGVLGFMAEFGCFGR